MGTRVAVIGKSPMWVRGLTAGLEDHGYSPTVLENLGQWRPGPGGRAVVMVAEADEDLDATSSFTEEHPHIPVIAVVSVSEPGFVGALLRAGASSALEETAGLSELVAAIEASLAGLSLLPTHVAKALGQWVPRGDDPAQFVSEDEVGWLRSMALGTTVMEIAERAGYSERAMFRNLRDLYARIGVRNRTEALLWAGRRGLLDGGLDHS